MDTAVEQRCKNDMCQKRLGSVTYYIGHDGPYCKSCLQLLTDLIKELEV